MCGAERRRTVALAPAQTTVLKRIYDNVLPEHVLIASGPPQEKPWGIQVFSR